MRDFPLDTIKCPLCRRTVHQTEARLTVVRGRLRWVCSPCLFGEQ